MTKAAAPPSPPKKARRRRRLGWVDAFLWAIRIAAIVVISWGVIGSVVASISGEGLTAEAWQGLLVSGVAQGSMYGLIALGYSMVYGVLGFINFAHGEVFALGAIIAFYPATWLSESGLWDSNPILSIGILFATSMTFSTLLAVGIERVAYRPLRNAPRLIPLITSIGISFFLQYAYRGLFGDSFLSYPPPPEALQGSVSLLGFEFQKIQLMVIVIAAISMLILYQLVARTKTGRAMRAVAEDREIAGLMGIDVDRTIVTTFAVGGAMAGIAGVLWGMLFRQVYFLTGFLAGIKAFTAAVLGGIGNMVGAYFGGLLLGLFEALGPQVVLGGLGRIVTIELFGVTVVPVPAVTQLKDVVAFTALVLILIFRPTGLFGERLAVEERG
ncbi:MAG: branched-chain amino acid ABC transporter permease [Acidimicrobiia bacterium]